MGPTLPGKFLFSLFAAIVSIPAALSDNIPVPNAYGREGAVEVEMRNVKYHFTDQQQHRGRNENLQIL